MGTPYTFNTFEALFLLAYKMLLQYPYSLDNTSVSGVYISVHRVYLQ